MVDGWSITIIEMIMAELIMRNIPCTSGHIIFVYTFNSKDKWPSYFLCASLVLLRHLARGELINSNVSLPAALKRYHCWFLQNSL
jgi:hypothetical protein